MATSQQDPNFLSEHDAHRVLARAVELDARAATEISVEQLHQIAEEAGIGAAALGRALHELRSGALVDATSDRQTSHVLARYLARHRWHALLAIALGAACITPGDVVMTDLLFILPAFALYEAVIRFARGRDQSGPSLPSPGTSSRGIAASLASRPGDRRDSHAFELRRRSIALAIRPVSHARTPIFA